ncbi:MAG: hypothetical protein ACYSWU_06465 [Planctomycetota bacterium]|jgi:hypothetical protein
MPELVMHTETFTKGYRLTTTSGGLRIEPAGAMQYSFTLDREGLARFGLRFIDDHYLDLRPGQEAEGNVDKMLASLDRAAELMIRTKPRSEWKRDIENLKRIYIILGGLDEKVVQQILDEEGK